MSSEMLNKLNILMTPFGFKDLLEKKSKRQSVSVLWPSVWLTPAKVLGPFQAQLSNCQK